MTVVANLFKRLKKTLIQENTPKERYEKLLLINYCMFNLRRQKSHQILMKFNLTIKNLKKEHSSNQTM